MKQLLDTFSSKRSLRPERVAWAFLVLLAGCAGASGAAPASAPGPPPVAALVDPVRRPGHALVLVAMPDSESFRTVRRALVGEIKKNLDVATALIDSRTSIGAFSDLVDHSGAACLVLMDNPTVKLYRAYQFGHQGKGKVVPAVITMASFLDELRVGLENATGVAYEVPGVTAFARLRSTIERPVTRIGVVHRPFFRRLIERQSELASAEQFAVVPMEVPGDASAEDVRRALVKLRRSGHVDALWVLNDSALLRDDSFVEAGWRAEVAAMGVPVVVGVPTLAEVQARFGTIALVPDLEQLGVQAGNVVVDIAENGWLAHDHPVELPVSTLTMVNMPQVRERFGLRVGASGLIDKSLE
jgi:ABC-type uncharacterized transport system substrate-binding protein